MKPLVAVLALAVLVLVVAGSPLDGPANSGGWISSSTQVVSKDSSSGAQLEAEVRWFHNRWPHRMRYAIFGSGSRVVAARAVPCIWVEVRWQVRLRSDPDSRRVKSCAAGGRGPRPIRLTGLSHKTTLLNAVEIRFGASGAPGRTEGGKTVRVSYH